MKICIVGCGAIGGYLAIKLAIAGDHEVYTIARGDQLKAIHTNGLTLHEENKIITVNHIKAGESISQAGKFDLVFLCVKAQQIVAIAEELNALFHEDTILLTTQNGIPWWYFQIQKDNPEYKDYVIESVDPGGVISKAIDPKRILGCVVYAATTVTRPGIIQHDEGFRYPIGELDGSESERAKKISELFTTAGLKCPVLSDIRAEIWLKIWGSCCFNPVSALTGTYLSDLCTLPFAKDLLIKTMTEASDIATKLGITFRVPLERRIAGAAAVGEHKTSMLQDVEAQRATEIDALVGAVIELGKLTSTPTPHLDTIFTCIKLIEFQQTKLKAK